MVIREQLKEITRQLRDNGNDNPVFEAHQIVRHILKLSATDLVLKHGKRLTKLQAEKISEAVKRRLSGEPLQYILGVQEFMSMEFLVRSGVLIPRADTETLVEYIIDKFKDRGFSLLDIGTGSGCIPISVAAYCPKARVRGIDISDDALDTAKTNCERLGMSSRAAFSKCDILLEIPGGQYDIITANPPYIRSDVIPTLQTEVRDYEPHLALDGGEDGLKFYRRICSLAPKILNKNGMMIFEIGYDQADAVSRLMEETFTQIEVIKDIPGNDRVVLGKLK